MNDKEKAFLWDLVDLVLLFAVLFLLVASCAIVADSRGLIDLGAWVAA